MHSVMVGRDVGEWCTALYKRENSVRIRASHDSLAGRISECLQVASSRLVANAIRRDRSPKPIRWRGYASRRRDG